MRLLIVGPQGAGKGTQAALLAVNLGVPHISTGDIFRANVTGGTELGLQLKAYMDRGELVPDSITRAMVATRLEESDCEPGFLLDGFPRNLAQSEWLGELLTEHGHKLDNVVLITAPDEVLLQRMLARGRADDTVEAINRRLEIYRAETAPLLSFYDGIVVSVDGVGEIEDVQRRILDQLGRGTDDTGDGPDDPSVPTA